MKTAEVQMGSGVPISTTYPMETGASTQRLPGLGTGGHHKCFDWW